MNNLATAPAAPLAVQVYPGSAQLPGGETLVLLHGWGAGSQSWQPLLASLQAMAPVLVLDLPGFGASPAMQEFTLDALLELIAAQLPEKSLLLGWSLGGMLAVQLAVRYPQKMAGVVTLAANAKFVASADYPSAMPLAVNQQFNAQFAAQPAPTLKLFTGLLAQGDNNERALLKQLRPMMNADAIQPTWHEALLLLAALDNRRALAQLSLPCLHLLAEQDVLVPASAAAALTQLNPAHQVVLLQGAAHALHWSQPAAVAQCISQFMQRHFGGIDKQKIARSFGRAAAGYDAIAHFQRTLGQQLTALLPQANPHWLLDLGCGTGAFAELLQATYSPAAYVALDISEPMLQQARQHLHAPAQVLAGDAEHLPLADQSVDIIFSNLVVQWCSDIPQLMRELARVLKPGGQLIFSTLAERSLCELKAAWSQVDAKVHVNHFAPAQAWQSGLAAHFDIQVFEHFTHTEWFDDLTGLTRSIKGIGAQNLNPGRPQGLSGRQRIQAFKQAYEHYRQQGQLPLSYDVVMVRAQRR